MTSLPPARPQRALRLHPLALALLACGFALPGLAQMLPSGFSTPTGGVSSSVNAAGNVMTIDQSVQRGIANWDTFSIGSGATVNVRQPNASAVLLNRVTGESMSNIDGALNANGHVYLINPNGILFGQGARVSVGGIVASTLDLAGATETDRNNAFLAGGAMKFANPGPGSATVMVDSGASITANGNGGKGGVVVLIGNSVSNGGDILAPGGSVALAAGSQVTLDPVGDGLTTLRVDAGALEGRLAGRVENVGDIQADGGRVLLLTQETWGLIVNGIFPDGSFVPTAGHIQARSGQIVLDAGSGGVEVRSGALDVGGAGSAQGGSVDIRGTDVSLTGQIVADSGPGGGRGGQVRVHASHDLTLDGPLSARGRTGGGLIETSGSSFYITDRFAVDASTVSGAAGTWILDPQDVDIWHGSAPPSPSANALYDSTVSAALDTGTSVTVTTPAGGSSTAGDVMFHEGVAIARNTPGVPVTFQVNAHRSIRTESPTVTIESAPGAGALNVFLNADADNSGPAVGGGQVSFDGSILSNGGNIRMHGNWSTKGPDDAGVHLADATLDSQARATPGRGDGNIDLEGRTTTPGANGLSSQAGLQLDDAHLSSGRGSITLSGSSTNNDGVALLGGTTVDSTTGSILVQGVGGTVDPLRRPVPTGSGVHMTTSSVRSAGGDVSIHGRLDDSVPNVQGAGVLLDDGPIDIAAGRDLDLAGSATHGAPGLLLNAKAPLSAGRHATVRAGNNGTTDAIVIGSGVTIQAGQMLDLRPGEVLTSGAAVDRVADPIDLASPSGQGFALSADEFSRLSAGTIVVGSNDHRGAIAVNGALTSYDALTLQNGGAGSAGIQINAPLQAPQLGLVSAGTVTQGASGGITAGSVLARSTGGDVDLTHADNNAMALGGSAAGRFAWVDRNDLMLAPVTVTGALGSVNVAQALGANTLGADRVHVQTLSQDLTLALPLSSNSGADLVAANRFQNPGAGRIDGAPWRVWADTWVGESRGGVAGSGLRPNLYGCSYGGGCGVTISPDENHFVYVQRPTATVHIGDASRPVGEPNPPFTVSVTGLRPGDSPDTVHGSASTSATQASPAGSYPISGSYSSDIGYVVAVVPGTLSVGSAPPGPGPGPGPGPNPGPGPGPNPGPGPGPGPSPETVGDAVPSLPSLSLPRDSATFDQNLAGAPICLASEPLDGLREAASNEVLEREWARVRIRPRLTNCVATDRRNDCGDF